MVNKQFKDVGLNQEFVFNGVNYKKVEEKRISCCRCINACCLDNTESKTQFKPEEEVQVNE